jgi:biotin carboxyl carrier protein
VLVNGKPYAVEIEDLGGGQMSVAVDGVAYEVEVSDENASPAVLPAAVAAPKAAVVVPAPRPAARPVAAAAGNTLSAPMPGVILDVGVKAGDKVAYGQQLCALEAMKMKNAIRAPRDVVIATVEVQEGQKVAHGDILFRFE